jgi:hypothetical protein
MSEWFLLFGYDTRKNFHKRLCSAEQVGQYRLVLWGDDVNPFRQVSLGADKKRAMTIYRNLVGSGKIKQDVKLVETLELSNPMTTDSQVEAAH